MTTNPTNQQTLQSELLAALTESVTQAQSILTKTLEQAPVFFQSNAALGDKVNERLKKGNELAGGGNYRAADAVLRHAIDLILQEDHRVFKHVADLRSDLLGYRDHHERVIEPLWQRLVKTAGQEAQD